MGSGSGGGGGGGGGGNSSGGSGYSIPRTPAVGSRLAPRSNDEIGVAFSKLLEGPPNEYYLAIFASDLVRDLYRGLVEVAVQLALNKNWQAIQTLYQVSPDSGCLRELQEAMLRKHGGDHADPRVREVCLDALESFFICAVGDSPSIYFGADANKVFQKANRTILVDSRSGYFLRELIYEVAKRQSRELPTELRDNLHQYSLKKADQILAKIESRFKDDAGQFSHNKIYHLIQENQDWFLNLFKKGVA